MNALNREAVPTKTGRHWTPATVHHMLRNEAYSGRTYYGKTKASQRNGRRIRERRAEADWIEVPGATPPFSIVIYSVACSRSSTTRNDGGWADGSGTTRYQAASAAESAGVPWSVRPSTGSTGTTGAARPTRDRGATDARRVTCVQMPSRRRSRQAATEALTRPEIVLRELEHAVTGAPPDTAVQRARLERQRERVLRLFQLGEIDEDYLTKETADIGRAA